MAEEEGPYRIPPQGRWFRFKDSCVVDLESIIDMGYHSDKEQWEVFHRNVSKTSWFGKSSGMALFAALCAFRGLG